MFMDHNNEYHEIIDVQGSYLGGKSVLRPLDSNFIDVRCMTSPEGDSRS